MSDRRFDFSPWSFWAEADEQQRRDQAARQHELTDVGYEIAESCFVSALAEVQNDALRLGPRSYVAAGAYLTGQLHAGRDCSINAYTVVRGAVRLGDAVRIGAHSSLLGFNHTFADPETEVHRQPLTARGIRVGDDVWIGSHAVVLDGVSVGARSVVAAGAVVTRDVPAGAVVGGNPARVLKWRVAPAGAGNDDEEDLAAAVTAFADRARERAGAILDRCFDGTLFVDRPGEAPTVRAQCDAVEIADLLLGRPPDQLPREEQVERLRGWQDPATGMVGPLRPDGTQRPPAPGLFDDDAGYHVLCVGYALELLGSEPPHPVRVVGDADAAEVLAAAEAQPWQTRAWHAGHWVDVLGTALHHNARLGAGDPGRVREALLGWLLARADPRTGMWGVPTADGGLLQLVNGYYRATRGTFAQLGVPVPYPERVVDTVLGHARDPRVTGQGRQNACNVLDIAHPLWLTRSTGHRGEEIAALARRLLREALGHWRRDGFGFRAPGSGGPDAVPGLQGTEMWLALIWYLADLADVSDALGYRPRGVHRPEPAPPGSAA
ncbi:acyltransferase [Georgenia alba]|uniref:Acyltransferase n=1 Tax=Georgenia alba TaxID=2233858 RepID=A0ABW2QCY7_9MICO